MNINIINKSNYYYLNNHHTEKYLNLLDEISKKVINGEDFALQQLKTGEFKVLSYAEQKRIDKKIYYLYFKKLHYKRILRNFIDLSYRQAIQNPELFNKPIYSQFFDSIFQYLNSSRKNRFPSSLQKFMSQVASGKVPHAEQLLKEAKQDVKNFFKMKEENEFSHLFGVSLASTLGISKNTFLRSGMPIFTTNQEIELIKSFLQSSNLDKTEKQILETYLNDLNRSYDLNQVLYKLDSREFDTSFLKAAELIYKATQNLKLNDSLYLDTSLFDHAMRLKIKKSAEGFELTLFDTSGYLEFMHSPTLKSAFDFVVFNKGHTALETKISDGNMKSYGKIFFLELLRFASVQDNPDRSSIQHKQFVQTFKSLGKDHRPLNRETTQKTGNCFAQRIRSCQKKYFGPKLYKKFRYHTLESVKKDFLFMAGARIQKAELYSHLKTMEIKTLSKSEFNQAKRRIASLKTVPQNFEEWQPVFEVLNHNLARLAA